jgi:hypothetical protein
MFGGLDLQGGEVFRAIPGAQDRPSVPDVEDRDPGGGLGEGPEPVERQPQEGEERPDPGRMIWAAKRVNMTLHSRSPIHSGRDASRNAVTSSAVVSFAVTTEARKLRARSLDTSPMAPRK